VKSKSEDRKIESQFRVLHVSRKSLSHAGQKSAPRGKPALLFLESGPDLRSIGADLDWELDWRYRLRLRLGLGLGHSYCRHENIVIVDPIRRPTVVQIQPCLWLAGRFPVQKHEYLDVFDSPMRQTVPRVVSCRRLVEGHALLPRKISRVTFRHVVMFPLHLLRSLSLIHFTSLTHINAVPKSSQSPRA
jgi:hypothetical protein